jgi:hypothetical protein
MRLSSLLLTRSGESDAVVTRRPIDVKSSSQVLDQVERTLSLIDVHLAALLAPVSLQFVAQRQPYPG